MQHLEQPSTWLITFADMITLLLCAFLMIFSLNYHRLKDKAKEAQIERTEEAAPGIQIAQSTSEGTKSFQDVTLNFSEEDFEADGATLGGDALRRLKSKGIPEGYEISLLNLNSCVSSDSVGNGDAWKMSEKRSEGLFRQLIDSGVLPERIREMTLGVDCDPIRGRRHEESGVVAQMRIRMQAKVAG